MEKRSMKSHRPLPKLELSGYALRRSRTSSGPWKARCLIGSAWVSGSIFPIFTKISPACSAFIPRGGGGGGLWGPQRFLRGEGTLKRAASPQLTRKAQTKQAFCVSLCHPFLTTSYGRLDYRSSLLRKQTWSKQRGRWVWAVRSELLASKPGCATH